MIEITCPQCGKQFRKSDEDKHSIVHCPYCFASMTLKKKQQTHKSNNIVTKVTTVIRHKGKWYLPFAACAFIVAVASLIFVSCRSQKNNAAPAPRPTIAVAAHAPTVRPTAAPTPTPTSAPTEHREGMYGVSNETIDIDRITFFNSVSSDATGKWRLALVNIAQQPENYALDYYRKMFKSDDEVHFIINVGYNTTTSISKYGNMLMLDVHEHISKEETDANKLGAGMLLRSFIVYLDNGDIEELE